MHLGVPKNFKDCIFLYELFIRTPKTRTPRHGSSGFCHFWQYKCYHSAGTSSSLSSSSSMVKIPGNKVGIFWDLENKPPKTIPPFEAATKLKRAVFSFGIVRYMIAYANRHAFSYVPPNVGEKMVERKVLNHLESKGVIRRVQPYVCGVCGRKFRDNEKLLNHFRIHECEHQKRVRKIESAKGRKRVDLVGKFAMNMEKYDNAVRDILTPKVGYGLADDLKRAGFWVKTVLDRPQAADVALRRDIVDMMDRRCIQCLVLVSDDSDFVGVLKEARERCLKTVVVGDNDGVLKRNADASFSWRDILVGKAKSQAVSVVGQWKDRDVLKKLEWSYNPDLEEDIYYESVASDDEDVQIEDGVAEDSMEEDDKPWWELDSDVDGGSSTPFA